MKQVNTAKKYAMSLHKTGQHVVLIAKNSKVPIKKKGWHEHPATHEEITQHTGNFGWMVGKDYAVVDVDTDGGTLEQAIKPLYDVVPSMKAVKPNVYTPSGGCHFYFIKPEVLRDRTKLTNFVGKVDYLTNNAYVLIPGCTVDGREYTQGEALGAQEMPKQLQDYLLLLGSEDTRSKDTIGDTKAGSERSRAYYGILTQDDLRTILERTDVTEFRGDMMRWARFAYSCNHATAGTGEDVFVEWAASDPEYAGDSHTVTAQFRSGDGTEGAVCTVLTMGKIIKDTTGAANSYLSAKINAAQIDAELTDTESAAAAEDFIKEAKAVTTLDEAAVLIVKMAESGMSPMRVDLVIKELAAITGVTRTVIKKQYDAAVKELAELRKELDPRDEDGLVDAFVAHLRNKYSKHIACPGGRAELYVYTGAKWEVMSTGSMISDALKTTKKFTGGKSLSVATSAQVVKATLSRISVDDNYFAPDNVDYKGVLGRAHFKNMVIEVTQDGASVVDPSPSHRNIDTLGVNYLEDYDIHDLKLWNSFLLESLYPSNLPDMGLGEQEWEAYAQQVAELRKERLEVMIGYTLAQGFPWLKKFAFVMGNPNTGKSVTLDLIYEMLGEGLSETFETKSFSIGNNYAYANVPGKAACIIPEVVKNSQMDVASLKAFVAGDRLLCQAKYKNAYKFQNHAVLWMAGNVVPDFTDKSAGVLTRLAVIPFEGVIPKKQRDTFLRDKLSKNLDTIATHCLNMYALNIIEDMCERVFDPRLEPSYGEAASTSTGDILSEWLDVVLVEDENSRVSSEFLLNKYLELGFAGDDIREANSPRAQATIFGRRLSSLGYKACRNRKKWDGEKTASYRRGMTGYKYVPASEEILENLKLIAAIQR